MKVERNEAEWIISLEGDYSMSAAVELKSLLLEGLASTKLLKLDLESASEIDVSLLQLLWAAESAARPSIHLAAGPQSGTATGSAVA